MAEKRLETMTDFFTRRVDGYDDHMLTAVAGCRRGYAELAVRLPDGLTALLDLGVGTGLELAEIYRRFPGVRVTGVDLCAPMLAECAKKFVDKRPTLLCGDYLHQDFGREAFDAAVSFETLHHLTPREKRTLFGRLCRALKPGGLYAQGDYVAPDDETEAALRRECEALREAEGYGAGERVHFDTPLTAEHECALLLEAGFASADRVWQEGDTALIVARKA
jgi:tRNA (cmo5U34)-methyltransferase